MKEYIDEEDPEFNIVHILNELADSNQGFTNKYLDSCIQWFQKNGWLTRNQILKLREIYVHWTRDENIFDSIEEL